MLFAFKKIEELTYIRHSTTKAFSQMSRFNRDVFYFRSGCHVTAAIFCRNVAFLFLLVFNCIFDVLLIPVKKQLMSFAGVVFFSEITIAISDT